MSRDRHANIFSTLTVTLCFNRFPKAWKAQKHAGGIPLKTVSLALAKAWLLASDSTDGQLLQGLKTVLWSVPVRRSPPE